MASKLFRIFLLALGLGLWGHGPSFAQQKDPWKPSDLVQPADMAAALKLPQSQRPVLIDVGPAGLIRGALKAGPAHEAAGMAKLKALLAKLPRSREVVVYCGCCPFTKCPNIRPAFRTLVAMGFQHPRLLNLSHNLKADWIDKGYPLATP